MDITPENLVGMFTTFSVAWQSGFDQAEVWSDKISTEAPSTTEVSTYGFLSQMPRFKEWLGERKVEHLAAHSYSLRNRPFELTLGIGKDKVEDDQYGLFKPFFQDYGQAAAKWHDDLIFELMQNAEATLCYDGQNYFDTDHPVDPYDSAKGTYSNLLTTKPLTEANYADARRKMRLFKGDNGRPAGVRPNLLVVPPQLEDRAKMILEADMIANASLEGQTQVGATNNLQKNTAELLVIDELGDYADDWYLLCTKRPIKPFLKQIRRAPDFKMFFNPQDPNVFLLREFIMGADCRGNAGVTLPILAMKCKG